MVLTAAGPAARAATPSLHLVERFGVTHPEQVVEFALEQPLAPGQWAVRDEHGAGSPAQVLNPRDRIAIRTGLPAGVRKHWTLVPQPSDTLVRDPVLVRTNTTSLELGNSRIGIWLPWPAAAGVGAESPPLVGLRLGSGPWLGTVTHPIAFAGGHEALRVLNLEVRVVEPGPLVAVAEVSYRLDRPELRHGETVLAPKGPGHYRAQFRLEAGEPSVRITEDTDTEFAWALDLTGFAADQARYRGHHATDARWGAEPDGRRYRPWHERPSMDAVMDLPFDQDYLPGWRTNPEAGLLRRLPVWDPWITDGGWYWQVYSQAAGADAPLLGLFAGRASLARDAGEAGAGLRIRGASRSVGLSSSARHRTGNSQAMPRPRFEWGLFAGTKADLVAPGEVQPVARQMNRHAGLNLTKLAAMPADFPDPPQGFGSPFMRREALDRLRSSLRADPARVAAMIQRDPQARELVEFWADPSEERVGKVVQRVMATARDLVDALVNGDGIYNFRFHYWHGGLEMSRALLWIDQALALPQLSAPDRAQLMAAAALFGAVLWDDDFVPLHAPRGINLGTPNMPVQQAGYRDQYALLLIGDPVMRGRAETAAARAAASLERDINEHGAHLACVHYIGASLGPTLSQLQQLEQAGVAQPFHAQPRLANLAEFFLQCATPPEPRFGGRRKQVSVGDGATESTELAGQLGTAFASANATLSRRLMAMWQAQGAPHSSFHGTTLTKIDDALPAVDPALGSARFPGQFTVLRHGWGTPRETAVWLMTGNHSVDHVHADEGGVILYAEGAPVSIDWGSMYEPRSAGALMHSVALPERMFDRPWNTDGLPPEYGGDRWGNYGGTKTTLEDFQPGSSGAASWVRSRMLAPDRSFTWTRAVSAAPLAEAATVVAIQDTFSGDGAKGGRIFTLNLCAEGAVETPAGTVLPIPRFHGSGSRHPDRRENPSAGPVFPLPAGIQRLRFTGQAWPRHPAGGVDFDVYVIADTPQSGLLGHWAHAWHPGAEIREFEEANGRPFEERQHILRLRSEDRFQVVLVVWPKGSLPPGLQVTRDAAAVVVRAGVRGLRLSADGELHAL